MARTINPEAFASKRKKILDATHRLVLTKGYEQMSIQDILNDVQMSSGAFHHYFDSRRALLQAFIHQIKHEVEQPLLPIIHDPHLSAIEKLQGFFDTLGRLHAAHQADVVKLLRVWYGDDNAVVRLKVGEAVFEQRAPLLSAIACQGVQEGVFTIGNPDSAGAILMSLLQGMEHGHARLLLVFDQDHDERRCVDSVVSTHTSYMDAVERTLGAPTYSLSRIEAAAVKVWLAAFREDNAAV